MDRCRRSATPGRKFRAAILSDTAPGVTRAEELSLPHPALRSLLSMRPTAGAPCRDALVVLRRLIHPCTGGPQQHGCRQTDVVEHTLVDRLSSAPQRSRSLRKRPAAPRSRSEAEYPARAIPALRVARGLDEDVRSGERLHMESRCRPRRAGSASGRQRRHQGLRRRGLRKCRGHRGRCVAQHPLRCLDVRTSRDGEGGRGVVSLRSTEQPRDRSDPGNPPTAAMRARRPSVRGAASCACEAGSLTQPSSFSGRCTPSIQRPRPRASGAAFAEAKPSSPRRRR
jgi:hypothetical protein